MNKAPFRLGRCPIVEAVVDIRCDMLPGFDLRSLEGAARNNFAQQYPEFRELLVEEQEAKISSDAATKFSPSRGLQALQFIHGNGKQLIQFRSQGYSFNRLAPYTTLDDYLIEIQRTWEVYLNLAAPVQVREVRLRYINRLVLPLTEGKLEMNDYLKIGPRLPEEDKLQFIGFFNQHTAVEVDTGHHVNIILTMQPFTNAGLPVIFDIEAMSRLKSEPQSWEPILAKIQSLRGLKNRVFENTLTLQCLNLYSQ